MLASDTDRRLLAQRGSIKEVSEAFAAYDEIVRLAREGLGVSEAEASVGRGVTVLDVCSGKGVVGHLLSRLLPEARVVMFDACRDLDLRHVVGRPNLGFVELDLFSAEAAPTLHEAALGGGEGEGVVSEGNGERLVIAIGMHHA